MYLMFFFTLFTTVLVITSIGTFSGTPGDPFPTNLETAYYPSFSSNPKKIPHRKLSSSSYSPSIKPAPINKKKSPFLDANTTRVANTNNNDLQLSSSTTSSNENLYIYKKHLINIAQWKYTDPKTNQTRYWYNTAGTEMGGGWVQDTIIFQAYIRQKADTVPIQSFHSETKGIWTNTIQLESTPPPLGNNQWKHDGSPFYVYKTSMNSSLLKPVWRYWNRINQGTEDVGEPRRTFLWMSDTANGDLPGWILDRILFYAFSPDMHV